MTSPCSERQRSALQGRLSWHRSASARPPSKGGGAGKRLFFGPTVPTSSQWTTGAGCCSAPTDDSGAGSPPHAAMNKAMNCPGNLVTTFFEIHAVLDVELSRERTILTKAEVESPAYALFFVRFDFDVSGSGFVHLDCIAFIDEEICEGRGRVRADDTQFSVLDGSTLVRELQGSEVFICTDVFTVVVTIPALGVGHPCQFIAFHFRVCEQQDGSTPVGGPRSQFVSGNGARNVCK